MDVGLGTIRLYNQQPGLSSRFSQIFQNDSLNFVTNSTGDNIQFYAGAFSSNNLIMRLGTGGSLASAVVAIGASTLTGTASQALQVGSATNVLGAYISGNLGIGTTNPTTKLQVQGDVSIASTVGIGTIIDIIPYDTLNSGTLSWEGSAGQLFSITNNLTSGSIFSVNDVSGIPSIDVNADGTIQLAPYGGNIGIGTTGPLGKLHITSPGITSSRPSNGWPAYNAETDTVSKQIYVDTAGNGNVSTASSGPTVSLVLGQYYDSRAVITPIFSGASSPSDQGTGFGKDLLIKGGTSDNSPKTGGRLFLSGGSGHSGAAFNTNYGLVSIQPFGGSTGIGTTNPAAKLHIGAGTTLVAPLEIDPGSVLTTPVAGSIEYDGTTIWATPTTGLGRMSLAPEIFTSGAGASIAVASNETTETTLFPTANDNIVLPIGTYKLNSRIKITRAASTTTATLRIRLSNGAATQAAGTFLGMAYGAITNTGAASAFFFDGVAFTAQNVVTATNATSSGVYLVKLEGILRVTTAGNFLPSYSLSADLAAGSGSTSPDANNWMTIKQLATSASVNFTGGWA